MSDETKSGRWTCPKCKRELDELDNYCGGCGARRSKALSGDERMALDIVNAFMGDKLAITGELPEHREDALKALVKARELLEPSAEARGRRVAFEAASKHCADNDAPFSAKWCLQQRDACGPAKADQPNRPWREGMRLALEDPDNEIAFRSNVAMLLHDRWGITDHGSRNRAAAEILALICRDDYVEVLKEHDRNPLPAKDKPLDETVNALNAEIERLRAENEKNVDNWQNQVNEMRAGMNKILVENERLQAAEAKALAQRDEAIAESQQRLDELNQATSRATIAARERNELRAEVKRMKKLAVYWEEQHDMASDQCHHRAVERDALRAEVERLKIDPTAKNWQMAYDKACRERDALRAKLVEAEGVRLDFVNRVSGLGIVGARPVPVEQAVCDCLIEHKAEIERLTRELEEARKDRPNKTGWSWCEGPTWEGTCPKCQHFATCKSPHKQAQATAQPAPATVTMELLKVVHHGVTAEILEAAARDQAAAVKTAVDEWQRLLDDAEKQCMEHRRCIAELRKLIPNVGDEIDCHMDGQWWPCKVVVGPQCQGICLVVKVEDPEQRQHQCNLTFKGDWRWSAAKWGDPVCEMEAAFHQSCQTVAEQRKRVAELEENYDQANETIKGMRELRDAKDKRIAELEQERDALRAGYTCCACYGNHAERDTNAQAARELAELRDLASYRAGDERFDWRRWSELLRVGDQLAEKAETVPLVEKKPGDGKGESTS